jgi:type VI secretion system protein ImpG
MNSEASLYREFLEELHELANFRLDYALDHPTAKLDWEDPDVKRVIEALAFFGARTHLAALRSVDATHRRLYQQFFSYLLTPLASMAMITANPTGHLTEALVLPKDTPFELQLTKGNSAMFSTTRPLRILPMALVSVKQEPPLESGSRLLLSFKANYPLNEQIGNLSLYLNYLNDFALSLKMFAFLKVALKTARVQFGLYDPDLPTVPCQFSFGLPEAGVEIDDWHHPLEAERYYFHFPRQTLYLELELPPTPRNWTHFTLVLDCQQPLPRQLRLHKDLFLLFTVPIVNNQRATAQPIICDGTQERYIIRHPQPELGFSLQKVIGVYEVTKHGMLSFRPGILAGGNGSYEVEQGAKQSGGGYFYWLSPHFPEAFTQPRTLVVDALWQQPWYDQFMLDPYKLSLFNRQIPGIAWALVDAAIPHAENQQMDSMTGYIHLLTLMHKPSFNFQNTRDLLLALGSVASSQFQVLFNNLLDLSIEEQSLGVAEKRSLKQIYTLQFKPQLEQNPELIDTFTQHVGRILDLWTEDAQVETRWEVQNEANHAVFGEQP